MGHGQSRPSRSSSDSSFTIMSSSNPTNHSLEEKNSLELSVEEPGESNKVKFTQRMHVQRIPIKRSKFNCFSTKLNRKYDTMVNGYRIVKDIGKGSFAKVKLVEKDGKLFAAKIFDGKFLKRKRTFIFGSVKTMWEGVQTELKILKSLDHPNIVKLYEVIEDPRVDKLILIMEYASGGSLGVSRFSDSECLNESEVKPIFKQLILAVQYRKTTFHTARKCH